MQALEWATMYPAMVASVVGIATTGRLSPQSLAFDAVGRNAIILDQQWNNGFYYGLSNQPEKGLAIARMIGHITYLSEESMMIKFGRNLQKKSDYGYDFDTDFQVESYLKYQGEKFVSQFDANSYLYLTKAISYFDLFKKYGTLEKAFANTSARYLIASISSDWLYPPKQSKELVKTLMKLNKPVSYCEIQSPYGHDAFLMKNPELEQMLLHFLSHYEHA
jgi:homoserine O-acetyltransferase